LYSVESTGFKTATTALAIVFLLVVSAREPEMFCAETVKPNKSKKRLRKRTLVFFVIKGWYW
jgi:hypothetical protein